jgi:hypothetical protein
VKEWGYRRDKTYLQNGRDKTHLQNGRDRTYLQNCSFKVQGQNIEVAPECSFLSSLWARRLLHAKPTSARRYREITRGQRHNKRDSLCTNMLQRNSLRICGISSSDSVWGLTVSFCQQRNKHSGSTRKKL